MKNVKKAIKNNPFEKFQKQQLNEKETKFLKGGESDCSCCGRPPRGEG